jgi:superfamily II DNA helicase RecQ
MLQSLLSAEGWGHPASVLRSVFGFPGFRGQQEEVVRHVVAGGDALMLAPTGGARASVSRSLRCVDLAPQW